MYPPVFILQSKIAKHVKKQDIRTHKEEKRKPQWYRHWNQPDKDLTTIPDLFKNVKGKTEKRGHVGTQQKDGGRAEEPRVDFRKESL